MTDREGEAGQVRILAPGGARGEAGQVRVLAPGGARGRRGKSRFLPLAELGRILSIPGAGEVFSGECIADLDRWSSAFSTDGTISGFNGRIGSVGYPPGGGSI